jgi:hypothetical protein
MGQHRPRSLPNERNSVLDPAGARLQGALQSAPFVPPTRAETGSGARGRGDPTNVSTKSGPTLATRLGSSKGCGDPVGPARTRLTESAFSAGSDFEHRLSPGNEALSPTRHYVLTYREERISCRHPWQTQVDVKDAVSDHTLRPGDGHQRVPTHAAVASTGPLEQLCLLEPKRSGSVA